MIADYKKTPRPRWAGAMLLLAALAFIVLTNAYVAKADFIFGTPTNLGPTVNSSDIDACTSVSADGLSLYLMSYRPGGYGQGDIYVATRDAINEPWGEPANLGPIVNSPSEDAGPSISSDGLTLYFFSDRPGGYGGQFGDLWMTTRETVSDQWSTPVNLGPTINSSIGDALPCISADELSLYFTRSVGSSKSDLWVTTRETTDDEWGTPVDLGPTINNFTIIQAPSISADGLTLFFQAEGQSGSADIWVTKRATIEDDWGVPVNLGLTVNSDDEERMPHISPDGTTLYFSFLKSGEDFSYYDLWQVKILPIVDFNSDGNIDTDDLLILIGYWGQDEPLCDIGPTPYGDGIVDIKDLEVFMSYWEKENMPEEEL